VDRTDGPLKPWPTSKTEIATALAEIAALHSNPLGGSNIVQSIVQTLDSLGLEEAFIDQLAAAQEALTDDQKVAVWLWMRGQPDKVVAETIGVERTTLWRWRQPGGPLAGFFGLFVQADYYSAHQGEPNYWNGKTAPSMRPKFNTRPRARGQRGRQ